MPYPELYQFTEGGPGPDQEGLGGCRGGGGDPAGLGGRVRGGVGSGRRGGVRELPGEEGQARVREAYPGSTWERLAAVKRRYDPTNLFHRNQNVPPAIQGSGR